MAVPFSCKCPERKKPAHNRAWVITQYKWNTSDFVKSGGEYSDYSQILCLECGNTGRSKAKYVNELPLMDHTEAYNESHRRRNNKK